MAILVRQFDKDVLLEKEEDNECQPAIDIEVPEEIPHNESGDVQKGSNLK